MKYLILNLVKLRVVMCLLSLLGAGLIVGCSDPSENVHKTTATEAQKITAAPAAASKEYVVRAESTIDFVGSKVTGKHDGGFRKFSGKFNVAGGRIVGTPEIKIAMGSVWSDNNKLTGHLKNADFFDVPNHPMSTFAVTAIEADGTQQKITGNLTLRGMTKSISFPANIQIADDAVTVKAEFAINRRDFNINYRGMANDLVRDNVVIKLDVKATPGPARSEDEAVN